MNLKYDKVFWTVFKILKRKNILIPKLSNLEKELKNKLKPFLILLVLAAVLAAAAKATDEKNLAWAEDVWALHEKAEKGARKEDVDETTSAAKAFDAKAKASEKEMGRTRELLKTRGVAEQVGGRRKGHVAECHRLNIYCCSP